MQIMVSYLLCTNKLRLSSSIAGSLPLTCGGLFSISSIQYLSPDREDERKAVEIFLSHAGEIVRVYIRQLHTVVVMNYYRM
jgi:hypothetical protein